MQFVGATSQHNCPEGFRHHRTRGAIMTRPWEDQQWVEPYRAAVLEMNPAKVATRISAAKSAIKARIAEIESHPDKHELDALQDALRVLFLLDKQEPCGGKAS